MSLFPAFAPTEFGPLFRLLDDYSTHRHHRSSAVRSFQPKFDVRELKDSYELHGELPGIEQKDITIEFTDPSTLVIKGRTVHEYTSGNRPGAIEGAPQAAGQLTSGEKPKQPTVEDEAAEETAVATTSNTTTDNKNDNTQVAKKSADDATVWVSERSVGEFHRSFTFPAGVDQDAVKASLKNGILSIVVPKAVARKGRKIDIE